MYYLFKNKEALVEKSAKKKKKLERTVKRDEDIVKSIQSASPVDLSFYPRDHTAERGGKGFLLFSLEPDFGGTFMGGLSKQGVHYLVGWYSLCQLSHQLPLVAHPSVFEVETGKENKENPAMLSSGNFHYIPLFQTKASCIPSSF